MGILLFFSPIVSAATWCPHSEEVTNKVEELATYGKTMIGSKTYHLIGRNETSIFYTEKLLENDIQLNGFLKISKLLDQKLPKPETRLIDLLPAPNFCAYKISMGENSQVIALSTTD